MVLFKKKKKKTYLEDPILIQVGYQSLKTIKRKKIKKNLILIFRKPSNHLITCKKDNM